MRFNAKKAQSTLEYILVLSAIVGVIIYAAATFIKPKVEGAFQDVNATITNAAGKIAP